MSPKEADVFHGTASFIEQEELDRFEATWWSPTCPRSALSSKKTGISFRLLYEKVDDREVKTLNFACPGKEDTSPMRYPLAGTSNSKCTLRLVVIENEVVCPPLSSLPIDPLQAHDVSMRTSLQHQFPWIEYIARAGFLNNGKTYG